jgi:UTP:GlnB (protein PII) uridylyltransferase
MAKLVLRNCYIEVNGVNFSSHVSSVTVNLSKDEIDTTNFGGDGRERTHGLKDDSFELNFQQNYASGSVDAVLYPLWDQELEFVVKVRPTSAAVGPNNPEYSATCILLEYQPLAGDVGDLSETEVSFPAQRLGIVRAVA